MEAVPENVDFNTLEQEILTYWDEIDAFQTSVRTSAKENRPLYTFYDGPPFATGLPHYGHILAGTIKDIVTRYAHQTGHHVERRFGWDCHGLPIEFEIDKEIGIKSREDVLKMGIPAYNQHCRGIVMRYSKEWEVSVKRLGRWIDFKNDYKTMDTNYMESVWWVFKSLYQKDLVYRGFKVMPYSPGCTTPLSNFESNSNYKDVSDPSVVVSFPLEEDPSVSLLVWTTTPWTLPSNLAICVHPTFDYVQVEDKAKKQDFILSKKRLVQLYKKPEEYIIKKSMKGAELVGKKYVPLFNYFERFRENGAFRVVADAYVTEDAGVGLVHQAPAFGEDDYRVCLEQGIIKKGGDLPCPIDADCCFTHEVPEHAKIFVKDADNALKQRIKDMGRLIQSGSVKHSYPFCWRSETPLIYRAVPCWFIAVEKIKPQLLANSTKSYWIPEHVKEGRFHNWLADARDWAVSRNRFWGTPLPIWISDDGEERVCVGSIEELHQLTGIKVNDLHRETVDRLTIPSKRGVAFGVLKRVEEVFDCWFESGSMPYAQVHYPFENKEGFLKSFPADFIAEGLDQTRGWFYTLLVLSTALFDDVAFKNVIVNGLVLAADGKKMSKRLKNYPDPNLVVSRYGADALRMYLINSPVVRAEPLKFKEEGVKALLKDVFLPWFNAFRFLVQNIKRFEKDTVAEFRPDLQVCLSSQNVMDRWILAATQSLISFVRNEMKAYRLYTVIPRLVQFVEQLTNWYVRLNRARLKGTEQDPNTGKDHARLCSLNTLYEVLISTCRVMSPFTPFFAEYLYVRLSKVLPESERQASVHFTMFPEPRTELVDPEIEKTISAIQSVIELGRAARDRRKLPLKFPLKYMMIVTSDQRTLSDLKKLERYVLDELNLSEFRESPDEESYVLCKLRPDMKVLGPQFGKKVKEVCTEIENLPSDTVKNFMKTQKLEIQGVTLETGLNVSRQFKGDTEKFEASFDDSRGLLVILNLEVDQEQRERAFTREVVNRIQKLRKKGGLQPTDPILIEWYSGEQDVKDILVKYHAVLEKTIANPVRETDRTTASDANQLIIEEEVEISESKIVLRLLKR